MSDNPMTQAPGDASPPFHITAGLVPGCAERITQLHAEHYAAAAGFGPVFEAKVAQELAAFCQGFTPGRDGLWMLVCQGRIEGSIAIDGQHGLGGGAHLRWFITSSRVRGLGGGRQLLARALAFVDGCGHTRTQLWTFAGLDAARHLYEASGFQLVHQSPGQQWGSLVTEQRFERCRPGA